MYWQLNLFFKYSIFVWNILVGNVGVVVGVADSAIATAMPPLPR